MFRKISIFLKPGKSNQTWGIWNFLEDDSKDFSYFLLNGTAEKIKVKMEQLKKIIHGKIMYVNKNRQLHKKM